MISTVPTTERPPQHLQGSWKRVSGICPEALSSYFSYRMNSLPDGVDLWFDPSERTFSVSFDGDPPEWAIKHWVNDLILPKFAVLDGRFVLHCSGLVAPFGAIGFVGPSGRGKSTLAAYLLNRGYELLGDDVVGMSRADPGYRFETISPTLRLLPDAFSQLCLPNDALRNGFGAGPKYSVEFNAGRDCAPVRCLFTLAEPCHELSINRVSSAQACIALMENSFAFDPDCIEEAKKRFAAASEIAREVPVFELKYPRDFSQLSALVAMIEAEFASTETWGSPS